MTELRLKAYYQYDGPCPENPLRSELSDDDVISNLKLLPNDFSHALDKSATIDVKRVDYEHKEIEILIQANCTREELHTVTINLLRRADLYGKIL